MEKVKLTNVFRADKDKSGNPYTTKDGRTYTRVSIKTEKHGDKWLSGFGNQDNINWKAGDEVEIEVKTNGAYLNFETPKKTVSGRDIQELRNMIAELQDRVTTLEASKSGRIPLPESELHPDDELTF